MFRNEGGLALQAQNTLEPVVLGSDTLYNVSIRVSAQLNGSPIRLFVRNSTEGIYSASLDPLGNVSLYQGQEIVGSAAVIAGIPEHERAFELRAVENVLSVRVDDIEVIAATVEIPLPAGQVGFAALAASEVPLTVDNAIVSWQEVISPESRSFTSFSTWSKTYYFSAGVQGWTLIAGKVGNNGIEDVNVGPTQYHNTANLTMQVTIPEGSTLTSFYVVPCIGGGSRHAYISGFGYTLDSGQLPNPINFGTDCVSGWGYGGLSISDQTSLVTIAAGNQVNTGYIARVTFVGTGNNPFVVGPPLPPEICVLGSGAGGSETLEPHTLQELSRCQIEAALEEYGIIVPEIYLQKVSGADFWTLGELEGLLDGVEAAAQAFNILSANSYVSDADAFRNIMLFNPVSDWIEYKRRDDSENTCGTTKKLPADIAVGEARATISCGGGTPFTQFVAVHELGHVFLHQTAEDVSVPNVPEPNCPAPSAFIDCMGFPTSSGSLGSGDTYFIFGIKGYRYLREQITAILAKEGINDVTADTFGPFQDILPGTEEYETPEPGDRRSSGLTDWERGTRGWGSHAPNLGACKSSTGSLPTDFQQNPCIYVEWLAARSEQYRNRFISVDPDIGVTEREEAGADMFLNWVYRTITQPSYIGFQNASWVPGCISVQSCPDQISPFSGSLGPGDDRWNWMIARLVEFFAYYGW